MPFAPHNTACPAQLCYNHQANGTIIGIKNDIDMKLRF
jgi:hypothetical protein